MKSHSSYSYIGSELDLFAAATNWKSYLRKVLGPYIRGHVLEVGAGIGATASVFCNDTQQSWTCLEPDPNQVQRIRSRFAEHPLPIQADIVEGTLGSLASPSKFDTILYIDVLEHIADDQSELRRARSFLKDTGIVLVLSPAHQWLFTPFDEAIGHYRRYSKHALSALAPCADLAVERVFYLDCAGLLASLANRFVLKSNMPSPQQLRFWDNVLVSLSRVVDPLTLRSLGKSVAAIYRPDKHR